MWVFVLFLTILPLLYSILSILSVMKKLWLKVWEEPKVRDDFKRVSIVLPLYKENESDILTTIRSICAQNYPKDLLELIIVVEKDDLQTKSILLNIIKNIDIKTKIVETCERKGKWNALNEAFNVCEGEVIIIFDAGDQVERNYIIKAVSMSGKYDIIGTKVYRISDTFTGLLSYVDTLLWYNVLVPAFKEFIGITLVSGEGLTLRERVKFPNCLAEDAFLSIYALKKGLRIGLLNSVIFEGAPSNFLSLFKQRLRWYRGFLECFLLMLRENLRINDKVKLAFVYLTPLASLSYTLLIILFPFALTFSAPSWLIYFIIFTFATLFIAPLFVYIDLGLRDFRIFLAPFHWFFQGFVVLIAIFIRGWFKTERSYGNLGNSSTSISQLPNSEGDGNSPL